jgi:hypothetical protein
MTTVSDARARNFSSNVWSNRFIIAAIVQGAVITGLTLAFSCTDTNLWSKHHRVPVAVI